MEKKRFGAYFACFLMTAISFGAINAAAPGDPDIQVSNEIMFYDQFSITDGLDKWTCHFDPITNKCEKTSDNPVGSHWNSWFLEETGQLHLFSDPAYPTGEAWAESQPQYSIVQDYVINLHFRPVTSSYLKVVDDGYVLLTVEGNDLYAYDSSTRTRIEPGIGYDWILIEIRVHLIAQNYDVYLGREWKNNIGFRSTSPRNGLVLGDDNDLSILPDMNGAGDWDNIIVAYLHLQTWSDDFDDGDIRDWTKVVSPPSFFDVSSIEYHSPPYSLRMAQPGEVVYGFTPYYDIAHNHDYTTQFFFRIPNTYSTETTVVADGNVRIIMTGTSLSAYISETDIRHITMISMNEWHDIFVVISAISNTYRVTVDGIGILEDYPFVDETETEYIRAPSQMFVGDHRHAYTGSEAYWDDQYTEMINNAPKLEWCGPPEYVGDGVDPDSGDTTTTFTYCVKYSDEDNDAPATSYPRVHIRKGGLDITDSPFVMTWDSWIGATGDYEAGAFYKYPRILTDPGNDYTYEFKAKDAFGLDAVHLSGDGPEVIPANQAPVLEWTGESNYVNDGLHPETGDDDTDFEYRIEYFDADNDPPMSGQPLIHIRSCGASIIEDAMTEVDPLDTTYTDGKIYKYITKLDFGRGYTYHFTAEDAMGLAAIPTPELEAPKVFDPASPPGTDIRLTNWDPYDWDQAVAVNGCNVHVVWRKTLSENLPPPYIFEHEIYYRRSIDMGITWDPEIRLTYAYGSALRPDIAVSDDAIHVVWSDNRNAYNNFEIYYKRSLDNGVTWDDGQGNVNQDRRLTNAAGRSDYPAIAVNGNNIHVLWQDDRDGYNQVYYKRSTNNGQDWTSDLRLSALGTGYGSEYPRVEINDNNIHVVWTGDAGGSTYYVIYTRSLNNGDTFDPETVLTTGTYAHIAVSESNIHINFIVFPNLYYKRSTDNGITWSNDIYLTNTAVTSAIWPVISNVASENNVHVVWGDIRNGESEIYYKKSEDNGNSWDPDTRLTNAPQNSVHPNIAVNGRNIHIVWADSRDLIPPIYAPFTEVYYEYRYE